MTPFGDRVRLFFVLGHSFSEIKRLHQAHTVRNFILFSSIVIHLRYLNSGFNQGEDLAPGFLKFIYVDCCQAFGLG